MKKNNILSSDIFAYIFGILAALLFVIGMIHFSPNSYQTSSFMTDAASQKVSPMKDAGIGHDVSLTTTSDAALSRKDVISER